LLVVFDPAVAALRDGDGKWHKTPAEVDPAGPDDKKCHTTAWFAGDAKVILTGGNRVRGAWGELKLQVWEASLTPKETRRVVLWLGPATDAEVGKAAAVTGRPAAQADRHLQQPRDYEVLQRGSRLQGPVWLLDGVLAP
jgi:hypothetical protein